MRGHHVYTCLRYVQISKVFDIQGYMDLKLKSSEKTKAYFTTMFYEFKKILYSPEIAVIKKSDQS